jgi:hypothetical protein
LADCANAEPVPAKTMAESAVAIAAREKMMLLPLMTLPSSPKSL